jgi:hypothetical protein
MKHKDNDTRATTADRLLFLSTYKEMGMSFEVALDAAELLCDGWNAPVHSTEAGTS